MVTFFIIFALMVTVLFLVWALFWLRSLVDEQQEIYGLLARLVEHQRKSNEAQQKLYEYMDLTRKEALDCYQKGLHDGIATAKGSSIHAPSNPIKTMEEHIEDKEYRKEAQKNNKELQDEINLLMNYTGDLPEGE